MSDTVPQDHISRKRVVYFIPGMNDVTVRREGEIDIYYPARARDGAALPAVVFVTGFSDAGAQRRLGCRFKEMGSFVSWAQLTAASGMVAITYANNDPSDVEKILQRLFEQGPTWGIDRQRLGIWACSGHGPNALSLLTTGRSEYLRCAALLYPYTIDLDGSTAIADASRQFGFVVPMAGRSVDELRTDVPLFVARAGRDQMPGLNRGLDVFVAAALGRNLPITVVNHAQGPHGFDVFDDGERSREIVRAVLAFLQSHLNAFS